MSLNITRGKIHTALKVVLYGPEGIGKTTFASQFPDPVFIDTEGSTKHIDVMRTDAPSSWSMLMHQIKMIKEIRPCRTLVIDTIDWAEKMARDHVCASRNYKSIEDAGYGKGYVYAAEEWGKMLNLLEEVVQSGIHVVLLAHAQMRKFEQPDEMGAYDRWEMKLDKRTGPMTKEWADMVLFANYKTILVTDSKTQSKKPKGGERVMYTTHHPAWDAKNRADLPEELKLGFEPIANLFDMSDSIKEDTPKEPVKEEPKKEPKLEEFPIVEEEHPFTSALPKALTDLMKADGISEEDIQEIIYRKGYFPKNTPLENLPKEFIDGVLIAAWPQVYQSMVSEGITTPF